MGISKKISKAWHQQKDSVKAHWHRLAPGKVESELFTEGRSSPSQRLCLFAHYSPTPGVAPFVFPLLKALRECDCDILFISTAPSIPSQDRERLRSDCLGLICRNNVGYDFGSWKTGLDAFPELVQQYDQLIFANDSVYGPLHALGPIIERVSTEYDVWALTASVERSYHLQTYFWGVSRAAIHSGFMDYFWNEYYRFYSARDRVIKTYELQIATIARERFQLSAGAAFETDQIINQLKAAGSDINVIDLPPQRINPTHHLSYQLIDHFQFPFVKRELFDRNPKKLAAATQIKTYIAEQQPVLWRLIQS